MPDWDATTTRVMRRAMGVYRPPHDASTMASFAYERVTQRLPMPSVFEVHQEVPIGVAIEEVLILAECSIEGEWEGQVGFLPLR